MMQEEEAIIARVKSLRGYETMSLEHRCFTWYLMKKGLISYCSRKESRASFGKLKTISSDYFCCLSGVQGKVIM